MLGQEPGIGEDRGQAEGPGRRPEQENAREHRQPDADRHQKPLLRRLARFLLGRVEADQQEGGEARHFPEHEEQHQVVGQHGPEHRRHEQRQHREEAVQLRVPLQVAGRIEENAGADAGDEQRHQPREPIHAERDGDAERRQPVMRDDRAWRHGKNHAEEPERHERGEARPGGRARHAPGNGWDRGERKQRDERQQFRHWGAM